MERTPDGFLFAVKLFQKFTHPDMYLAARAGRDGPARAGDWDVTRGDIDQFRAGIEPLVAAGRIGALLVQFPSSFHATAGTRDYLTWLLAAFREYPLAVELRHRSWRDFATDTPARLAEAGAAFVEIDEPFAELRSGPVAGRLRPPGALAYFRFHGRNTAHWWAHGRSEDRYNYLYTPEEMAPFADAVRQEAALEQRVLAYFNNHFSAKAVTNADILKRQLGQITPD